MGVFRRLFKLSASKYPTHLICRIFFRFFVFNCYSCFARTARKARNVCCYSYLALTRHSTLTTPGRPSIPAIYMLRCFFYNTDDRSSCPDPLAVLSRRHSIDRQAVESVPHEWCIRAASRLLQERRPNTVHRTAFRPHRVNQRRGCSKQPTKLPVTRRAVKGPSARCPDAHAIERQNFRPGHERRRRYAHHRCVVYLPRLHLTPRRRIRVSEGASLPGLASDREASICGCYQLSHSC